MRRGPHLAAAGTIALVFSACTLDSPPSAPRSAVVAQGSSRDVSGDDEQLDEPLPGLTPDQLDRFNRGRAVFSRVFTDQTGLGPSFNSNACASCHEEPSTGGFGDDLDEDVEMHVSVESDGACLDLAAFGGAVIQHHTTAMLQTYYPDYLAEAIPSQAGSHAAHRTTPALFGFGLLEAIPASTIIALADPTDANGDGVRGRPSMVSGEVARFGRKATDVTLLGFNAGAFQNEMGITSSIAPAEQRLAGIPFPFDETIDPIPGPEISDDDLALATDFVRFLAPPPQLHGGPDANDGRQLFSSIGCATCHVPSLRTGPSSIAALSNVNVQAFTDLLLHDMGPGLADICRGGAGASEFRTEPLMGLRFRTHFLHDARSPTLEDAIAQHGGEASRSRDRFAGLKTNQKAALIAYLKTL
ncbi:MAG TPA: di-heme oxidoredictase family protein [Gemmatimonadaceae bacterium]|jgi:CxxC motif-containing protein (DUF1111 family)|nr:di-heme oxidoredictase family protein [Gemmatimonadaceae bacterium]